MRQTLWVLLVTLALVEATAAFSAAQPSPTTTCVLYAAEKQRHDKTELLSIDLPRNTTTQLGAAAAPS